MDKRFYGILLILILADTVQAGNPFVEAGKGVGQGARKIGKETGKAFKEGGKEIGQGFHKMGKETGKEAGKAGRSVGESSRDAGRKTGEGFRGMWQGIRKFFKGE